MVRFAKSLDFSSWREFLKEFTEEQNYQDSLYTDIDPNFPFIAASSAADIITQICSLQVESLLDTADLMDRAPLDKIVNLLQVCDRDYIELELINGKIIGEEMPA